jgi:hypothetical protein
MVERGPRENVRVAGAGLQGGERVGAEEAPRRWQDLLGLHLSHAALLPVLLVGGDSGVGWAVGAAEGHAAAEEGGLQGGV